MGNKSTGQLSPGTTTSFIRVWLGINPLEIDGSANQGLLDRNEHQNIFDDEIECEAFIRSAKLEAQLILSVSEAMANDIVPRIHQLSQIKAIFICQGAAHITEPRASLDHTYSKVKTVPASQLTTRIVTFEKRWLSRHADLLSFTVFDTTKGTLGWTSTGINGAFLFSQLLTDILVCMDSSPTDKDELIESCSKAYKANPAELKNIRDFRDWYKAEDALRYYTKPTFLHSVLNESLRTLDIDSLFLYRFFIRDLRVQLAANQYQSRIHVYRGQLIRREERERLENSIGHLISVNTFFSTTRNREVAEGIYLRNGDVKQEFVDSVLFEIDADPAMVSGGQKPFADISTFSEFSEEEEVLFMLGSLFEITEVCCRDSASASADETLVWIFKMKLCHEDQHDLKAVFHDLRNDFGGREYDGKNEATINSFAIVLYEMHKFELAGKFFRRLLRELPRDDRFIRARCYHNMGNVALQQDDLRRSSEFYQQALTLLEDDRRAATTHLCFGNLFSKKKKYSKAFDSYRRALALYERQYGPEHPRVALCYGNIGSMFIQQRRWTEAREFVEKCLAIEQHCFFEIGGHPQMAFSHASLGVIYSALGEYGMAIEHDEKAVQLRFKFLPPDHVLLLHSYNNLAIAYDKKGDFAKSTEYYQRAEAINRQLGTATGTISFRCPRCNRIVWIYHIFRFWNGSTCFECRREQISSLWRNF